jgi:cation diffusion facilitator family transporter
MELTVRLGIGSLVVGAAVLGIKYLAFMVTGSIALYSDALESLVNLATAVATLLAVRLSAQPADANHPFGHHKVEYFSAVFAGVLIVTAALMILSEAWSAFLAPRTIDAPAVGIAISFVATLLNAAWSWTLIRHGRRVGSPALVADGRHLRADVATSIGVIGGIALAVATGRPELDPALAGLVALNILWSGWTLIRESLGGLMDEALPEATQASIRDVIAANAAGAIEAHDVRTRQAGPAVFVDFHLVVPSDMTVAASHEICDRIEAALREAFSGARVTIHVEPEHKAKQTGVPVV